MLEKTICVRCGTEMIERKCKPICKKCGFFMDCTDLFEKTNFTSKNHAKLYIHNQCDVIIKKKR